MTVKYEITTHIKITDSKLDEASVVPARVLKKTIAAANAYIDKRFVLGSGQTLNLWDPNNDNSGGLSSFQALIIYADATVDLELTTNQGDANEELSSVRIGANIPFMLAGDESYFNHSAGDSFGGTLDVVDRIRVKEPNSQAVVVTMILIE